MRLQRTPAWTTFLLVAFVLMSALPACSGEPSRDGNAPVETAEPAATTGTEPDEPEAPGDVAAAAGTVVEVARADGRFTRLVAALDATGLAASLQGPGPFTIFAPTDAAFAALPEDPLADRTLDDRMSLLLYHVSNGRLTAADVAGMAIIPTAQGDDLRVTVGEDGVVRINDAVVTATGLVASNGVLHVLDAVLLPPSDDAL